MAFKHFPPNFERERTFTFVHGHVLDYVHVRLGLPTFGCARRNGKRPRGAFLDEMADSIRMMVRKEIMTRGLSTLSITHDSTWFNVIQGPSTTNMATTSVFPDTNIHIRFLKLHNLHSSNECAWRCTFPFNSIERMFMDVSHCHTTPKHECVCMCNFKCNPVEGMHMNVHILW